MTSRFLRVFFAVFVVLGMQACSKSPALSRQAIVSQVQVEENGKNSIRAQITLKKSLILNEHFFYGADLQYSTLYDKTFDLYSQSSAMGHIPAFFRLNGKELQLVADNRRLFPSDVNHPERLISRYSVISESPDTITVSEADSSQFLVTTIDPAAASPREHWARSFQFVGEGNYLLQESSVVMSDGSVAEIMESVFPQSALAPSSEFLKLELDPESAIGASEGIAYRYRFLPGETIRDGEKKLAFAQHFDIGEGKTIDWYVTRNIRDEDLEVVQDAVEGWNRYFNSYPGIHRDVLKFKGRLPEAIKLGDPRYNVINWDSRRVAGAAYETQANDPFTGKQSHSLIYMPVAWFQIGMDYWTQGQFTDAQSGNADGATPLTPGFSKRTCFRDLSGAGAALHSSRFDAAAAKTFSIQLMKQTLFHEVGHALGLAHNFKGSLSFDRKDPKSLFSTSIMDYNDYEIERAAFESPHSSKGPLLEYDRQALSALYNQSRDVAPDAPWVPACNDAEADTESSGAVDPLCMRYDIENDPTRSLETAYRRITEAHLDSDVTLTQALNQLGDAMLEESSLSGLKTEADLRSLQQQFVHSVAGVVGFYLSTGKASLLKTVKANLKSLYVFEKNVLPQGYQESEMRGRALIGVKNAAALTHLPEGVTTTVSRLILSAQTAVKKTPAYLALTGDQQVALLASFSDPVGPLLEGVMMQLRGGVEKAIKLQETIPFYFGTLNGQSFDLERELSQVLTNVVQDLSRPHLERLAAAKSIASYASRPFGSATLADLRAQAEIELKSAKTNEDREFAVALVSALGG